MPSDRVFISATHTHSGWDAEDPAWGQRLEVLLESAVRQASEWLAPARLGPSWGVLHGHSINRRRLEDPVDPAVFAVRIDSVDGRALGVYCGFRVIRSCRGPTAS